MYRNGVKRCLDLIISALAIVLLSPLFLLIALCVKLDSPGPVFFRQKRVGLNKRYFTIYKFRTMRADTPGDVPTHKLQTPKSYITRVGRFLRRTSLDELPQLFNVLRGDMALIGPRPALWNQYDLIELRDRYDVHRVLPGISGWAQVNGRDALELEQKAKRDGEYAAGLSFAFDLKCVWLTIRGVVRGDGIMEGARRNEQKGSTP